MNAILDSKDSAIISALRENSSLSHREVSKKTRIPLTTVHNRIQKMKKAGIIKKYTIEVNWEKVGKMVTAYILVSANQHPAGKKIFQQDIAKEIRKFSPVETVDIVTGQTDILVKVRCTDVKDLDKFITQDLRSINGVDKTVSMIVLEEA